MSSGGMMVPTDAHGNEIGKLFVGGLDQCTSNDTMRKYFSKFGEIEEAIVMMDHRTNRSRGFGYVKFKNENSVDNVLNTKPHIVDSKTVDAKQCNINMKGKNRRSLKIFVGGIAPEQNEDTVRAFFKQYGDVTDVNLMIDPTKQRHRGFAFVGFSDEQVVADLVQTHYLTLNGKQVEVKAMEPPNMKRGPPGNPGNTWNQQPQWGQQSSWNPSQMWNQFAVAAQQPNPAAAWDQNGWSQWANQVTASGGQWDQTQQNTTAAWAAAAAGAQTPSWPQSAAMATPAASQWGSWDQAAAAAAQNGTGASAANQWNTVQQQAASIPVIGGGKMKSYQFGQNATAAGDWRTAGLSHNSYHPYKR